MTVHNQYSFIIWDLWICD